MVRKSMSKELYEYQIETKLGCRFLQGVHKPRRYKTNDDNIRLNPDRWLAIRDRKG